MNRIHKLLTAVAVTALVGACTTTPDTITELETARAVVPQVEASPRAGVAATYISEARQALDRANQLAERSGKLDEARFEATIAARNAQIANEKILTAQAREELEKGEAERQAVLIEARERDARMAEQRAEEARRAASLAGDRAKSLEQELADLKAKPTPRGMVLTLGDVLFDTGKSTLKPGAYRTIDRLAEVLKNEPDRRVIIEGHTDSVGSEDFNMGLSERRAESVQSALFERGVSSDQIEALGRGETTPVASNENAGGRQQNRRVELIFPDAGSRTASDVD